MDNDSLLVCLALPGHADVDEWWNDNGNEVIHCTGTSRQKKNGDDEDNDSDGYNSDDNNSNSCHNSDDNS